MWRQVCALTLFGVIALQTAAGRSILAVPAVAPAADLARPQNDLTFILTCNNITFKTETMLVLGGVAEAVPYYSGKRVNTLSIGAFTNSAPGSQLVTADGTWLDAPQALVYGTNAAGNLSSIALGLNGVRSNNQTGMVKFNVTLLQPTANSLKLSDGPISTAIMDNQQGTGPKLATMVKANETWTAVTLVIESTRTALKQQAETKTFGLFFGGPGGWGGNGWGNGYGGGYGYGNGWGGPGWGWGK